MAAVFTHPENKSGVFSFLFNSNFSFLFLSLDVQKIRASNIVLPVRGCISLPFRYSSPFSTRFVFVTPLNDLSSEYVSPAKYSMQVIFENVFLTFFLVFFFPSLFWLLSWQEKEKKQRLLDYVYITMLIYGLNRLIAKQTADNTIRC